MTRSNGFSHVMRRPDASAEGAWGSFTLKSAFQPIFAFREGKLAVTAFEGLVRPFRDTQPIGAWAFLSAVAPADRLNVDAVLRSIHMLNAGAFLPADASIFINFDPSALSERAVADAVLRDMRLVLHEAGVPSSRVVCEMTEQRLSSEATFLYFVASLREAGFRVAVDDYGAEDSDIERIRAVGPDIVKFDAKWITRLMESGPGFALLAAMVESFRDKGIQTVFEGIEEGWQLELAERAGASMVQGYVLHKPELVPTSFANRRVLAGEDAREPAPFAFARVPAAPFVTPTRPAASGARVFGRRTS